MRRVPALQQKPKARAKLGSQAKIGQGRKSHAYPHFDDDMKAVLDSISEETW
jgi:hypothetical protein